MASRKEQKEALREERERRAQEAQAAEKRRKLMGYGAAGLLGLVAIITLVVLITTSGGDGGGGSSGEESRAAEPNSGGFAKASIPRQTATTLDEAAKAAGCRVQRFPDAGANHVAGRVEYKTNPPTSGDHFELPAEDGAYANAPEMEPLVHSLEHGRVVLWFQPRAAAQLKGQMKALFDEDNYHVVLAPNARNMKPAVAASAWTRSITCPEANDKVWDALRLFRDNFRDQGPEQVP